MKQVFEAYIDERALRKAQREFEAAADKGIEAIGLLAGEAGTWEGQEFVEGIAEIASSLAKKDGKMIVGWIHSHPSYGCFMSTADENAQRSFFPEKFSVAIVVDPINREKKVFKIDANGAGVREASYAVIARKTKTT